METNFTPVMLKPFEPFLASFADGFERAIQDHQDRSAGTRKLIPVKVRDKLKVRDKFRVATREFIDANRTPGQRRAFNAGRWTAARLISISPFAR